MIVEIIKMNQLMLIIFVFRSSSLIVFCSLEVNLNVVRYEVLI